MTALTIDLAREADLILEVLAAGIEARAYVRGGMDPLFNEPTARDIYAKGLARLSPSVAAAFLRGWAEHHETAVEAFAWHRFYGSTRIEVAA